MKLKIISALVITLLTHIQLGIAGTYTIPKTYADGDTLMHSDLNNENTAVKAAIDDNYARLPAVKMATRSGIVSIVDNTLVNVITLNFTPTSDGYVLLTATGDIEIDSASTGTGLRICISNDSTLCDDTVSEDLVALNGDQAGAWYAMSYSIQRLVPVTAGTLYTFYVNANEQWSDANGTSYVRDSQLSALYVPLLLP